MRLTTIALIILAALLPTNGLAQARGEESPDFYLAIDVSRSMREWVAIRSRVVADVATLPAGGRVRVVTFGAAVHATPIFDGVLSPPAREAVLRYLEDLQPTARWTFFKPVLDGAREFFEASSAGRAIGVIYSDGKPSLPSNDLQDVDIGSIVSGRSGLDVPFALMLWRPATRTYTVLGGSGIVRGGRQLTGLEDVLAWQSPVELAAHHRQQVEMMAREAERAQAEARFAVVRSFIEALDPWEIILMLASIVLGTLGVVLRRWLNAGDAAATADTMSEGEDQLVLQLDPRTVPHAELADPLLPKDPEIVALPSGDEPLLLTSEVNTPGGHWVADLPCPLRLRRSEPGYVLMNEGSDRLVITTDIGNELTCKPGHEKVVELGDEIRLPDGWVIRLSPPRSFAQPAAS